MDTEHPPLDAYDGEAISSAFPDIVQLTVIEDHDPSLGVKREYYLECDFGTEDSVTVSIGYGIPKDTEELITRLRDALAKAMFDDLGEAETALASIKD